MAVPQQQPSVTYAANGVATTFAIPFKLIRASDLSVWLDGNSVSFGYGITGLGNDTATITFSNAPTGELLLLRDVPLERLTDYQTNGDLLATTVNLDFDRLWMAFQDMLGRIGRALSRPLLSNYYDAEGRQIKNLADAGGDQDAINGKVMRSYVDASIAGLVGGFGYFVQAGSGALQRTFQEKMREIVSRADFATNSDFNAAKSGKLSLDASNRLRSSSFIAGGEELAGSAALDSFVVGRNVTGATDCHGFADRTIMDGVTDSGTYGSFDSTVKLNGSNNQNHVYSFQDRVTYNGSSILDHQAGFLSIPVHSGAGDINLRTGVDIRDVNKTGTGRVLGNIGVYIRDLVSGSSNVALNILQTVGFAIFAPGGAPSYFKGQIRVGNQSDVGALISAQQQTGPAVFMTPSATAAYMGATGDYALQLYTNAGIRLEIAPSSGAYAVRPGADASQPLGDASRRWSQVFAATSTISTSDAREKTAVRALTVNEVAAAKQLAGEIGAFRFLSAVSEKGDSAREHIGMTVQRAIEVMEQHGLEPFSYSFICYDQWEDGGSLKDRYSFRIDALLAFIAAGFEARISYLEKELTGK